MNEFLQRKPIMDDIERIARAMAASGFFRDVRHAAQAIVKILAGQELGFGPFASMTGVHIIDGKPVLAAHLIAAAIKRSGKYGYRVLELTDTVCEIAFYEGSEEIGRSRFTLNDARRAEIVENKNWIKYPRNMLFARAVSNGYRWFTPDIFGGVTVYTPDELGAEVDEDGNIINTALPAKVEPWTRDQLDALIKNDLALNDFGARGMLGLSNLPHNASPELIIKWGNLYRSLRPLRPTPSDPSAEEAARYANKQIEIEKGLENGEHS